MSGVIDAPRPGSVGKGRYDFCDVGKAHLRRTTPCNDITKFNPLQPRERYQNYRHCFFYMNIYSDFNVSFLAEKRLQTLLQPRCLTTKTTDFHERLGVPPPLLGCQTSSSPREQPRHCVLMPTMSSRGSEDL